MAGKQKESPTSARKLLHQERLKRVWEMRVGGWTRGDIAHAIGVDPSMISRYLAEAYAIWKRECDEEYSEQTRLDIKRYDDYLKALQPQITAGDSKAIMVANKILSQRATLMGLNATKKIEITTAPTETDEIRRKIEEVISNEKPMEDK